VPATRIHSGVPLPSERKCLGVFIREPGTHIVGRVRGDSGARAVASAVEGGVVAHRPVVVTEMVPEFF
jgi:hypothetical protein